MAERRKSLSNIIKLRRPVERVKIEHSFGGLRRGPSTQTGRSGVSEDHTGPTSDITGPQRDDYHRGVEAGKAEAMKELSARFEERIAGERERVGMLVQNIRSRFSSLHGQWEESVMRFAFAVAHLIVKREISIDREIVLGQVREALRHLVGAENVRLRIHPLDEEILRVRRNDVFAMSDSLRDLVFEVDDKIERGGCIVESELGNVDARLSTQLKVLEARLWEEKPAEVQP